MKTEAETKTAFDIIRYGQCWEDADVLIEASRVGSGESVLSICSAADNSFSLLAAGAGRVVAVDMSLPQIMLAHLKAGAYQGLQHDEMLAYLGYTRAEAEQRRRLHDRVERYLPESAAAYWRLRLERIDRGIVATGKFENYFTLFRKNVLPLIHSTGTVEQLCVSKTEPERRRFYDERWNTWRWRILFAIFFSRFVMGRLGRDPRFFDYVDGPVAGRIRARAEHALVELDPARNPYLQWILFGEFRSALPHAVCAKHFESIAAALRSGRLELHHGSIEERLDTHPDQRFDAFNLNDIFEYMSQANYERLLQRLIAVSNSRARLVYWNMLAPRSRPDSFADRLHPQPELAAQLHARDRAFFYSRLVVEETS